MNHIEQYRPAFFEGFKDESLHFDTLDELLSIPWVANFSKDKDFHKFSISDNTLMAEYRGGEEWWVVGFLKDSNVRLPKFSKKEEETK